MSTSSTIRAGRAFVELFALRLTQGKTDDSKLVRGLKSAERKLKAFGTAVKDIGRKPAAVGAAVAAPWRLWPWTGRESLG